MSKQNVDASRLVTVACLVLVSAIVIKATYDSIRSQMALDKGKIETIDSHQVRYVEFDGHQYVKYTFGKRGSLSHSPKCPCTKKENVENE